MKMYFMKKDEFWYIVEYCSMLILFELPKSMEHIGKKKTKTQMLMAHCFKIIKYPPKLASALIQWDKIHAIK